MRRRRLRKKQHLRCIEDVLVAVMNSDRLAPSVRALATGQSLPVAVAESAALERAACSLIRRWALHFKLTRVTRDDGPADPYPVQGAWLFRFEAHEFPSVVVWAEEFPDHLGS